MRRVLRSCALFAFITLAFARNFDAATVSQLFERGYNVIPLPQQVSLKDEDFEFGV
jgi:hypothetical protein